MTQETWKGYWVSEESEIFVARSLEEAKALHCEWTGDAIEDVEGGEADPFLTFTEEDYPNEPLELQQYIDDHEWDCPTQLLTYYA